MNNLLESSNELLGSSEWDRRIQQVSESADGRILVAAEQSRLLVNDFFRRTYMALGVLCAALIFCLAVAFLLMWRLRIATGKAGQSRQRCGEEA